MRADYTGSRFGRLLVIERTTGSDGRSAWHCQCTCGNFVTVRTSSLTTGNTKSCGCYHREIAKEFNTIHGLANSLEYRAWSDMKTRCLNPDFIGYSNYGGRGITICERWLNSFDNFLQDMGRKPSRKYTLDRIDTDGNYEPSNCRWVLMKIQQNNRRNNHMVEYEGKQLTIAQLADETKVNYQTLLTRLRAGLSVKEAVENPIARLFEYKGECKTVTDWAKAIGMSRRTLQARIERGWSIEKAIETPIQEFSYALKK